MVSTPVSAVSGFVTRNGKELSLDGQRWRFVGVNRYNLATLGGSPYIGCGGDWKEAELVQWFEAQEAQGVNAVRFWLFQGFTNSGDDMARFDFLLQQSAATGVKLIPVFENQWQDCTQGYYKYNNWYRSLYLAPYGNYPVSYKEYVRRVVSKYKDNPNILMWQLMNESESKDGSGNGDYTALYNFANDMSSYIKSLDQNHLISLGTMGSGQPGTGGIQYKSLHEIPEIDILEYHDYNLENEKMPVTLSERLNDSVALNKPIFIGEAGIAGNCTGTLYGFPCFSLTERARLLDEKMKSFFDQGGDGYLIWSGQDKNPNNPDMFAFNTADPLSKTISTLSSTLKNTTPPTPTSPPTPAPTPTRTPVPQPTPTRTPVPTPISTPVSAPSSTAIPALITADINKDLKVDIFDYNLVMRDFNNTGTGLDGDVNKDEKVDIFDYNIVLRDYGKDF